MIIFFSGTLTYQFFDTSPKALQQNLITMYCKRRATSRRCETPVWSKPMTRPLFSVLIRVIIKLIIKTIRHHVYCLSTRYEIMWFWSQHNHKLFVPMKSRYYTTAWYVENRYMIWSMFYLCCRSYMSNMHHL